MTLRILFGAFMLFSGVSGLYAAFSGTMEGVPAEMVDFLTMLSESGIFYMIKVTETVAGAMILFNFLPALGVLFLAPVAVGIIVVNALLTPAYLPMGIVVALFEIYFGYFYWDKYKALFIK